MPYWAFQRRVSPAEFSRYAAEPALLKLEGNGSVRNKCSAVLTVSQVVLKQMVSVLNDCLIRNMSSAD